MSGREQFAGGRALPAYLRALGRYLQARFLVGFVAGAQRGGRVPPSRPAGPPPAVGGGVTADEAVRAFYTLARTGCETDTLVNLPRYVRARTEGQLAPGVYPPAPGGETAAARFTVLAADVAQRGWAYPDELYELACGQLRPETPGGVFEYGDPRAGLPTRVLGVEIEHRRRTKNTAPPETNNPGTR